VSRLKSPLVIINNNALAMTKMAAALVLIAPDGISLFFVLGLSASNLLSASLLNPIAAFLANIMQSIISRNSFILKLYSSWATAKENPISANGMAKIVWLNFTSEKYFLKEFSRLIISQEASCMFHNFRCRM